MRDVLGRRRSWLPIAVLLLGGCEPIPPSGDIFAPVPVEEPTAPSPEAVDDTPDLAHEVLELSPAAPPLAEAELPPEVASTDETDPLALQAILLGKPLETARPPEPDPVEPVEPAAPTPVEVPATHRVWDPDQPLPEATFGVRVLSTLSHLQPPRAVLGLPDGTETVVQAGTILPDQHVIVMAIGRDVVQLARVVPEGYYARIETTNVHALFPTEWRDPSR